MASVVTSPGRPNVQRNLGQLGLATGDERAHLRRVLIGPCRLHQGAPGRAIARFGDGVLAALLTGGILAGDQAVDSP
jgi:hypothetical protein